MDHSGCAFRISFGRAGDHLQRSSGDILDKGKVYGEFDFAYSWDASAGTYTPRVVAGIGHRIEIGINVNGIASPGPSQTTPTPTIKWKAYDGGKNGWVFILGDDVSSQPKTEPTMPALTFMVNLPRP